MDTEHSSQALDGDRFLRVRQILNFLPVSRSTFYQMVADGRLPLQPVRLSSRCTVYRESEVREAIERMAAADAA